MSRSANAGRRRFLQQATAFAVAFTVVPRHVLGRGRLPEVLQDLGFVLCSWSLLSGQHCRDGFGPEMDAYENPVRTPVEMTGLFGPYRIASIQ